MTDHLTYYHSAGDILIVRIGRPERITREQALDLLEQHHNAITAGQDRAHNQRMFEQMDAALQAQERWARAAA